MTLSSLKEWHMINFDRPDVVERIMWEFEVIMENGEKTFILNQGNALKEIMYELNCPDNNITLRPTMNHKILGEKPEGMSLESFLEAYDFAEDELMEITIKENPES